MLNDHIKQFAEVFSSELSGILKDSELTINSKCFDDSLSNGLSLVEFTFAENVDEKDIDFSQNKEEFNAIIDSIKFNELNFEDIEKYVAYRVFYYFDDDKIYFARPKDLSLWTRGQGVEFARNIANDIMFMQSKKPQD